MIRLVRIATMTGDWEKINDASKKLGDLYTEKYPQVKDLSYWGGVTGPLAEIRTEMVFDSMAEEEAWAIAVMQDPVYLEAMGVFIENLQDMRDELYRRWEQTDD